MAKKIAILIAIEKYQQPQITNVIYAEADALELSKILQRHGYTDQHLLINADATKTIVESIFRRVVGSLRPKDELVIYYAGHGFSKNDQNYITAFDTQIGDLDRTSISLQNVLNGLRSSPCKHIMVFLDSCESGLPADLAARHIISSLSEAEIEQFFRDSEFCVFFSACKTGESSYPARPLKHGVWSFHLIEALAGEASEAIVSGHYITASSLQDYLSIAIPRSIAKYFKDPLVQTPWFFGGKSRDFLVADVEEILREKALTKQPMAKQLLSAGFHGESLQPIKGLRGFRSHHKVPRDVNQWTSDFAKRIAEGDVSDDVEEVFNNLRNNYGFKSRDIEVEKEGGSGIIICPAFDYRVDVELNPDDPSEVILIKEVTNIKDPSAILSDSFDYTFPDYFDSIEFVFSKAFDIQYLINQLEDIKMDGLSIDYPSDRAWCELSVKGHPWVLTVKRKSIIIEHQNKIIPSELIALFNDAKQTLLPSPKIAALLFSKK